MQIIDSEYSGAAVYMILNSIQKRAYIGSTMNYQQRVKSHYSRLTNKKHSCKLMQEDFNNISDGWQINPVIKLDYPIKSELMNYECSYINDLQKEYFLYNKIRATHNHIYTKDLLLHLMADKYCIEHYGVTFGRYTENRTNDFIEMTYLSIKAKTDDERKQIQEEYNRRLVLRKKAKKKRAKDKTPE